MANIKINYELENFANKGTQNSWEMYEFVYNAQSPEIFNGKKFARIAIALLLCKNAKVKLNGHFTFLWYTICDENGNLLKTPNLSWSFSDEFNIPNVASFIEGLNDESFNHLIETMTDLALSKRFELREPLQESINRAVESGNSNQAGLSA